MHTPHARRQLRYDGYESVASTLSNAISSYPPTAPSSRLSHLIQLGLKSEGEGVGTHTLLIIIPCNHILNNAIISSLAIVMQTK